MWDYQPFKSDKFIELCKYSFMITHQQLLSSVVSLFPGLVSHLSPFLPPRNVLYIYPRRWLHFCVNSWTAMIISIPPLPLWPLSFSFFCLLACFVFIYALEEDKQCDDTLTTSRTTTHAQQFRALTYWMVVCLYLSLSLSSCVSDGLPACLSTYLSVCVLSLFLCLPLSTKSFFISLFLFSLSPFANW